jgi:LCP family protein required for cell wall assembly
VIGTTETAGISEDDASVGDRPNERLADTIMLVRVEPATQQASVLSVNRDLWIPDVAGYRGRINGAYQAGDADLLITVLREYLGVEINDVVKVNFAGFEAVVDELGGVPVYFEHPTFDEGSFFARRGRGRPCSRGTRERRCADEGRSVLLLARNLATRPQFVPVIGRDKLTLTIGSDWRGVTLAALPEEDFAGALPVAPLAPSTTVAGVVTTSSVPTPTEPADVDTGQGVIGKPAPGVPCD